MTQMEQMFSKKPRVPRAHAVREEIIIFYCYICYLLLTYLRNYDYQELS